MERHSHGIEDCRTTINVEARDLDTDARWCTSVETEASGDRSRQRAALIEAVAPLFPGARLRSFSDGAATFLDAQHLVVASFADLPEASRRLADAEEDERQDSLFAA